MTYRVEQQGNFNIVHLDGEVDLSNSPQAREQILKCLKQDKGLLVDLSRVEYIDSSGVASLVEGYQEARKKQLSFGLIGVSAAALSVLQLARLDKVFPLYDNLEAALSA